MHYIPSIFWYESYPAIDDVSQHLTRIENALYCILLENAEFASAIGERLLLHLRASDPNEDDTCRHVLFALITRLFVPDSFVRCLSIPREMTRKDHFVLI
jgi:hypothetical protein